MAYRCVVKKLRNLVRGPTLHVTTFLADRPTKGASGVLWSRPRALLARRRQRRALDPTRAHLARAQGVAATARGAVAAAVQAAVVAQAAAEVQYDHSVPVFRLHAKGRGFRLRKIRSAGATAVAAAVRSPGQWRLAMAPTDLALQRWRWQTRDGRRGLSRICRGAQGERAGRQLPRRSEWAVAATSGPRPWPLPRPAQAVAPSLRQRRMAAAPSQTEQQQHQLRARLVEETVVELLLLCLQPVLVLAAVVAALRSWARRSS